MMQTGCPACTTVFRITPEQLKARQGQVRCGQCGTVFDALVSLVDAPSAATALGITLGQHNTSATTATTPSSPPHPAPGTDETPPPQIPDDAGPQATEAPHETASTPLAPLSPPRPMAWPWVCATLLSLLLLLGQAIIQFRVELSVIEPALKPALQALCEPLGCDVPLPRKAELLGIETTDLHPDPQHKGILILAATLKNRAPFAQSYPDLELSLTDSEGQPLLRKIMPPAEYLPGQTDIAAGFGASQSLDINIALIPEKSGKPAPTDYRLYLFYP